VAVEAVDGAEQVQALVVGAGEGIGPQLLVAPGADGDVLIVVHATSPSVGCGASS